MENKLTAQQIVDAAQRDINSTGGVMLDVCSAWKEETQQAKANYTDLSGRIARALELTDADYSVNCDCYNCYLLYKISHILRGTEEGQIERGEIRHD